MVGIMGVDKAYCSARNLSLLHSIFNPARRLKIQGIELRYSGCFTLTARSDRAQARPAARYNSYVCSAYNP